MWASFHRASDRAAGAEIYRNKIITHAFDPAITPHYLRHTYCSNFRCQGVDLENGAVSDGPQRHSDDGQHLQPRYRRHPKMQEAKDAD